ncbi:MAG: DUF2735 domain-containing protein [Mesorhizobium sp.]
MNSSDIQPVSAKIYLFPVSPRFAKTRFEREVAEIMRDDKALASKIDISESWYHDEAVTAERKLT